MRNQFIFIAIFIGTLYSQCDSYILSECDSNSNCEWIEDTSYASCSSLGTGNSSFCDAQANCSYSWLTYSCGGGTYEVDNSYCEEIEVLECSDLGHGLCMNDEACEWVGDHNGYCQDSIISVCDDINEPNCNNNDSCNWVEEINVEDCNNSNSSTLCGDGESCTWVQDISSGWCGSLNNSSSCSQMGCSWGCDGCWYLGECCGSYICTGGYYQEDNSYCGGGNYEIDSSYCTEVEVLECSEMDEPNCNIDDSCEWVEEIDSISCYSLSEMNCGQVQGCNWGCSDWGDWYTWICYEYTCQGGTGQMDNSYCEEIQYLLGDVTGDFSINVLDVIQIVNLILNNEYNMIVDMNNDNQLNVLDVILVVDIILGN